MEKNSSHRRNSFLRPLRYLLWGVIIGTTLGFGASELWHQNNPHRTLTATTEALRSSIRSDFTLIDHTGRPVTNKDYRGKWLLVFFGFTNCPDVCPTALNEIAEVLENIGELTEVIQPLFISIDPDRDTPEHMAEYVAAFDPRIVGLTGTPEQIKAVTTSFKVYYAKAAQEGAPEGYTMEHTASLYLIDPQGFFVKAYTRNTTIDDISADLQQRIPG